MRKYPDLQTIYDKTVHIAKAEYGLYDFELEFITFTQTFSDTAGLLRKDASDFAGQAFTDYVITVAHDITHEHYYIFQDDNVCYGVFPSKEDTNNSGFKLFKEHLEKRTLIPLYKAREVY